MSRLSKINCYYYFRVYGTWTLRFTQSVSHEIRERVEKEGEKEYHNYARWRNRVKWDVQRITQSEKDPFQKAAYPPHSLISYCTTRATYIHSPVIYIPRARTQAVAIYLWGGPVSGGRNFSSTPWKRKVLRIFGLDEDVNKFAREMQREPQKPFAYNSIEMKVRLFQFRPFANCTRLCACKVLGISLIDRGKPGNKSEGSRAPDKDFTSLN